MTEQVFGDIEMDTDCRQQSDAIMIDAESSILTDGGDDEDATFVKLKKNVRSRKGRGFTAAGSDRVKNTEFENFEILVKDGKDDADAPAQRSSDGWILFVTGIHEEAHEEDIQNHFSDYGTIKNLHLNLDRQTGFLKGYALIEFETFKEADLAKKATDGGIILGNKIAVDWAFMKNPLPSSSANRRTTRRKY